MEIKEAITVLKERMSLNESMIDESDYGKFVNEEQEALKVALNALEEKNRGGEA